VKDEGKGKQAPPADSPLFPKTSRRSTPVPTPFSLLSR
jgi:hypothetical protein